MVVRKDLIYQNQHLQYWYQLGRFDNWQVNLVHADPNGKFTETHRPPQDKDYLGTLLTLGDAFDVRRIFDNIYAHVLANAVKTNGNPEADISDMVRIDTSFQSNAAAAECFNTLYMAMISEWHYVVNADAVRKHGATPIRSRYRQLLKAIAVYQVLAGDLTPDEAAKWSIKKQTETGAAYNSKIREACARYGINYWAVAEGVNIADAGEQFPL